MPLARGAGDRNRRERREWVTLDHNQKLGSALINYARAKEAVQRARAHKELANPALNDAHVDGFGPGWPNVEKVLAGMQLPNTKVKPRAARVASRRAASRRREPGDHTPGRRCLRLRWRCVVIW